MNVKYNRHRAARWWQFVPLALLAGSAWANSGPPPWLLAAARQPTPGNSPLAPAVVLWNETEVAVDTGGRASTLHRKATRILTAAGRSEAMASVSYTDKSDWVDSCEAWLIRGGKPVELPDRSDWTDVALSDSDTIYSEYRARGVRYADVALPGDVFGYETCKHGPMLFLQYGYYLGGELPVMVDRLQLQIPSGWTLQPILKGTVVPLAAVSPDRRVSVWELRDRPYRPDEPWTPSADFAEAAVMVTIHPPSGKAPKVRGGFNSWREAADWAAQLNAGQCDTDPVLVAKVGKLVADCPDNLTKMRVLGRYVQELRYTAVDRELGIGFGMRARKATEVLARGWGDCKDKANLLRAMLREAGIRAYLTPAKANAFGEVYPEWPSPLQFNHAIVAIEADADIALPAVVPTSRWGRLLFFDPTDPDTVLGDLPRQLQGSYVLVLGDGGGELMTLPDLPVEPENLEETKLELSLATDGSVSGKGTFGGLGQSGAAIRRWLRTTSTPDLGKKAAVYLNEALRGVAVKNVTSADDRGSGRCSATFEFSVPNFVQFVGGGLALTRLNVASRGTVPRFVEQDRRRPVKIWPAAERDEVVVELPSGFKVDELPQKTALAGPFGSYENFFETSGQSVLCHRTLRLVPQIVSVSAYPAFQKFLSDVAIADRTAVVLRQAP